MSRGRHVYERGNPRATYIKAGPLKVLIVISAVDQAMALPMVLHIFCNAVCLDECRTRR